MSVLQSHAMINFLLLQLMKAAHCMFTWQEKEGSSEICPFVQELVHNVSIYFFVLNVVISLL